MTSIYDVPATQVLIQHEDFDYILQIDSGGLGDFFSHEFEVSVLEEGN